MLLLAFINQITAIDCQQMKLGAAMANGCLSGNWHYSCLYLPKLSSLQKQSTDYSVYRLINREDATLLLELNYGRYRFELKNLVVPR